MKDSHQDITTQIYNLGAKQYKKSVKDFIFPGNMLEYFMDLLPGKDVLDIGCGFGRDVKTLRNNGFCAIGIDISEKLIEAADPEIRDYLQIGDMCELGSLYQTESFDGIISSASLVHLDKNISLLILQNIYQILTKNGAFFITLKISKSGKTLFKNSFSLPGIQKKYVYYREEEILEILKEIGFQIHKTHILKTENDTWMSIISKK